MARKNVLFPVVAAIAVLGISTPAYAKHGAPDDNGVDAAPHKLARGGSKPEDNGQDALPHKLA